MSRQLGRSNGGQVARGAGFAAAKGAGLIGLAVVIGIVLLNVVDDGSSGPTDQGSDNSSATTTATTPESTSESTTPTTEAGPPRTPDQLAVIVLNGGAPAGSAKDMSDALKVEGYTNQSQAADWTGREQTGNTVLCRAGLEREAATLATAVGEGTPTDVFPDPPPTGAEEADCIVVVGAPA
jgi:hypothetical protein